jgi:hypothetical protein
MASQNLAKRRAIRALETKRDELSVRLAKTREELAAVRAALKQRRKEA